MTKIALESQHIEWLSSGINQNLLKQLQARRLQALEIAENLSSDGESSMDLVILLTKAKTIRELIKDIQTKPELLSRIYDNTKNARS